jgi:hypothetical protein
MPSGKIATVTPASIALHLSEKPMKKGHGNVKRVTSDANPEEIVQEFIRNFSSYRLLEALVDYSGDPIDVEWIISRLLDIFDHPETKASERISILDRFQEYLVLGAIQDPKLAERIQRTGVKLSKPGAKSQTNPFALKIAGG